MVVIVVLGMTVEVLLLVKMNVFLIQTRKRSVCYLIALLRCIEGNWKFGGFQIQFNLAVAIPMLIGRTYRLLCVMCIITLVVPPPALIGG